MIKKTALIGLFLFSNYFMIFAKDCPKTGFYSAFKFMNDNKLTCLSKNYYSNNKIFQIGNYKNGRQYGEWKEYYYNGKLKSVVNFVDGKIKEFKYYDTSGTNLKVCSTGLSFSAIRYKKLTCFFSGHVEQERGQAFAEGTMIDGKPNGEFIFFALNIHDSIDSIKSLNYYKNGKAEGEWKTYWRNGNLEITENYNNNVLEGEQKVYYKNGNLRSKGNVKKGQADGEWEYYDESGNVTEIIGFKNGKQIY